MRWKVSVFSLTSHSLQNDTKFYFSLFNNWSSPSHVTGYHSSERLFDKILIFIHSYSIYINVYSQFCVSKVPILLHLQLNVNECFRLFKTFVPIICHNIRMKHILPVYSWMCVFTFISSPIFIINIGICWCIFLHFTSFTFSPLRFVLFIGTNNNATNLHLIYINYVLTYIPTTVSTCTFYFTLTSYSPFF